jgi:hypothetical protein
MVLKTISLLPVRLILFDLKYSLTLLFSVIEKSSFVLENVKGDNFKIDFCYVIKWIC